MPDVYEYYIKVVKVEKRLRTWSRMMEFGISWQSLWATEMWLSGESKVAEVGVRTISAPRARRVST